MRSAMIWLVGYSLALVVAVPLRGLLISLTGGWFVPPVIQARGITIAEGIGLSLLGSSWHGLSTSYSWRQIETDMLPMARVRAGTAIRGHLRCAVLDRFATFAMTMTMTAPLGFSLRRQNHQRPCAAAGAVAEGYVPAMGAQDVAGDG